MLCSLLFYGWADQRSRSSSQGHSVGLHSDRSHFLICTVKFLFVEYSSEEFSTDAIPQFRTSHCRVVCVCVCVCVCEVLFPLRYAQKQYLREHDPGDKNEKPYIFKPPGQSSANRASDSKTAAATVSHQCSLSCLC